MNEITYSDAPARPTSDNETSIQNTLPHITWIMAQNSSHITTEVSHFEDT